MSLTVLNNVAFAQSRVTDDAFVSSATPTSNNGTSPSLVVQAPGGKSFIRLDLSQIPTGAVTYPVTSNMVAKATVTFYVTAVTASGSFDVYTVANSWSEKTITFNNAPALGAPVATGVVVNTMSKYVVVDITALVKNWLDCQNNLVGGSCSVGQQNYGIELQPSTGSSISVTLESKESTTTGHDPQLSLVLTGPAGPQGPSGSAGPQGIQGPQGPPPVAGTGISITGTSTVNNTGVLSTAAGQGIAVSGATGNVTISVPNGGIAPSQVSAGTYGINVSGNAATATNAGFATNAGNANTANSATNATNANNASNLGGVAAGNFARVDQGNTFNGNNSFSGKVDSSGSSASLPVKVITGAPSPGACAAGQMVFQSDAPVGQQLFVCNSALNGWVLVTDTSTLNSTLQAAINSEASARQSADTTLQNNVNAEASARQTADAAETSARQSADSAETSARQGADTTLQNNINNETSTRQAADAAEAAARALADTALSAAIASETTRATGAESTLTTNLNGEISRAQAAEATKADLVKPVQLDNSAAANGSCSAVNALVLNPNEPSGQQLFVCRDIGGNTLQWQLVNDDTATGNAANAYTDQQVAAEASARQSADTTLQNNINTEASARQAADSAETTARQAADAAETSARQAADTAEASARAAADTALSVTIASETARATGAESTLTTNLAGEISRAQAAEATKADLVKPVQIDNSAAVNGSCSTASALVLNPTAPSGQQLFVCRDVGGNTLQWQLVNDDTATGNAANAYTDQQVAAEASARQSADSAETSARQAADTTLQNNINNETSARQAADAAEAAARAAADTALSAAISSETTRATGAESTLTTNLNGEISRAQAAEATKADLVKPVQIDNTAAVNGSCSTASALVLNPNQPSGEQLFVCRDIGGNTLQWQLINDDTATSSAANTYTDQQVAAEASARQAADTTLQGNINNETSARQSADAAETSARQAADAAEASARATGDAAAVVSANAYTDTSVNSAVATINTSLAGKANLAGGNTFTGTQTINGNASITGNETVNGTLSLPATTSGSGAAPSHALELAGSDGSNDPTLFRWQVNNNGKLDLLTATGGNSATDSGLMIGPDGKLTFAAGQTFPGTQSALTAGSGIDISGSTISIPNAGVTNAMLQNSSIGVVAGAGISVSGTSTLGGTFSIANAGVITFNGRTGAVTPQNADYSFAQLSGTDSATSNLVYNNQANSYGAGNKQTFIASATTAGLSFDGGVNSDPSSPASGDLWFNTTANHLKFYDGASTKTLAFSDDTLSNNQLSGGYTNAVTLNNAGNSFTGSGSGLTSLNAGNVSSGTLSDARLSGNVAFLSAANLFIAANTFSNGGNSFTGSGSGLSSLNASNISSGSLADARLSNNVTLLNGTNSFSGANSFTSSLTVPVSGGAAPIVSGRIAYDSTANLFRVGINGATKTLATTDATVTTASSLAATTQCNPASGGNGLATGISTNGSAQCSTNGAALVSVNAAALNNLAAATTATANTIAARDGSANLTANQFNGNLSASTVSVSSTLTVPVAGGAAPTVNGQMAYDSTANAYKVGMSGATQTLLTAAAGGGNTQLVKLTANLTPVSNAGANENGGPHCSEQSFTVAGLQTGDVILSINPPSANGNIGLGGWRNTGGGSPQVAINFCNPSSQVTSPPAGNYIIVVLR